MINYFWIGFYYVTQTGLDHVVHSGLEPEILLASVDTQSYDTVSF